MKFASYVSFQLIKINPRYASDVEYHTSIESKGAERHENRIHAGSKHCSHNSGRCYTARIEAPPHDVHIYHAFRGYVSPTAPSRPSNTLL
jgi:hypothetical protein